MNRPNAGAALTGKITTKGLFITGTDTDVGKTYVTCMIARQLIASGVRVGAYKPVCTGVNSGDALHAKRTWDDVERLKAAIGGDWPDEIICPQRFDAALAPPNAAEREGRTIDFDQLLHGIQRFTSVELLLIEGAGGWLCPLTRTTTIADLAEKLELPILIVARAGLGTINHTLLTIESIRSRRLPIAGVILNEVTTAQSDLSSRTNAQEIQDRSGIPVFGTLPHGSNEGLRRGGAAVTIDWVALAKQIH